MSPNMCPRCGRRKQSFETRHDARTIARKHPGRRLRVYPCGAYWHLTSVPAFIAAALRERTPAT